MPASENRIKKEKPIDELAKPIDGPAKPTATAVGYAFARRRSSSSRLHCHCSPDLDDLLLIWQPSTDLAGSRGGGREKGAKATQEPPPPSVLAPGSRARWI